MNKIQPIIKKILKTVLWLLIVILFLIILTISFIQLHFVQNKIAKYATTFISNKTHTRAEIKNLTISFPRSVIIDGLYLEDHRGDTLLYAGRFKLDIALFSLLKHHIDIESFLIRQMKLNINNTSSDSSFNYNFLLTAFSDTLKQKTPDTSSKSEWKLDLGTVILKNISLIYHNEYEGTNVSVFLQKLEVNKAAIGLAEELIAIDNISLEKSSFIINSADTILHPKATTGETERSNWKISIKNISLNDNSFYKQLGRIADTTKSFNPNHLDFKHLTLVASDLNYSQNTFGVSIKNLSVIDQNEFSIKKFETVFSMDQHSITMKDLKAETDASSIETSLAAEYSSLKSLKDSLPHLKINLNLQKLVIRNSDILYFKPGLSSIAFFQNKMNVTTLSGTIKGRVNDLRVENILVETGAGTTVTSNINITGLPDNMILNIPELKINTSRQDIDLFAGSSLPKKIKLPENLSLHITFKGEPLAFESTIDLSSDYGGAKLIVSTDKDENFTSRLNISNFDLGSLLGDKIMYGPVTLIAMANGHGFSKDSIMADVNAEITQVYLNKYTYHNFLISGKISGQEFSGKINLNDENAIFSFDGLVNINPKHEKYAFKLDVEGADLQKLHLTENNIRISLNAVADLSGQWNSLNGKAGVTNLIIAKDDKIYTLDSLLFASVNNKEKSELSLSSAIVGIKYSGTISPADISGELNNFINNYFQLNQVKRTTNPVKFDFEISLHNHPVLSQLLIPQLKEFEPGIIKGSFDSEKKDLKFSATIQKIVYGTSEIKDLSIDINSDLNNLNYKISSAMLSGSQIALDNFSMSGELSENTITADISSISDKKLRKLIINSLITKQNNNYRIKIEPGNLYLMNNKWDIDDDNFIEFGKEGILIHNFFLKYNESRIDIASANDQFNDDYKIGITNFQLDDISRIIEKDTNMVKGILDGNLLLKKTNNSYGLIADARINDIVFRGIPVGSIDIKAENSTAGRFDVDLMLEGNDNRLKTKGYFIPGSNSLNIKTDIQSLSMQTIEAFSMGKITEASGILTGNLAIGGSIKSPEITGKILFDNVSIKPAILNNKLELKHETIELRSDGIYFDSFTLTDVKNHSAVIDGSVRSKLFHDFRFDLKVSTSDFLLFNSTVKDNKLFYGRMVIDSKINISGPLTLPVINGRLRMKDESNFTFVVPENRLTTDRGEDVVEFGESGLSPIISGDSVKVEKKSGISGFDISAILEVDKQAELRLIMDPTSTDSLVVKGDAALSLVIDPSGKISLTGSYHLEDGSYMVSLEFVKRKFDIVSGSSITWNGDPLDADVSINTKYIVRASPYDLMAGQLSGISDAERGSYKQPYQFWVLLNLTGDILHPRISFEIQLPPENKGILGGSVNQKLLMLKDDESELNKQVFALLVLGRFLQENPLQTEGGGTSTLVRSTVGNFLSSQLNKFGSRALPGVELNFDIQSYNEYETGQAKGRTQVEVGVKKQLFNDRLSVQVGGSVDVEGEKARQNSNSNIAGDVNIEYKLTDDGRLRLKAFRQNQYEGAIEGQITETGAGIVYVRDFKKWKNFLKPLKKKDEQLNK